MTILTIGHCAYLFKYTHDSMPIEEVYGVPDKKQEHLTEDELRMLIKRIIPVQPDYPSREMFDEWWIKNRVVSIFAGCPPLCEGILTERVLLEHFQLDLLA